MKCMQKKCSEDARLLYYWPGSTAATHVCPGCGLKAQGLARFMGFLLPLYSIPDRQSVLPVVGAELECKTPAIEPKPQNPERSESVTDEERTRLLED